MRHAIADQDPRAPALLAAALSETVADLRLIDVADLVAYVRTGRWANIADLVRSSAEFSFLDGALTFACSGEVAVGYVEPATVALDMEFQHGAVAAFFTLSLAPRETRVVIDKLWFASEPADGAAGLRLFERALTAARLTRAPPPR